MNAQIAFMEGQFNLIHVPLSLYSFLLEPILKVLLPYDNPPGPVEIERLVQDSCPKDKHLFLNISVSPIECSIVCSTSWTQRLFKPVLDSRASDASAKVQISKDAYNIFSVNSAGIEAGQRVIDLTSPLAMAGIPIFFITTYYTDFILVPCKDRQTVEEVLLARGFEFSENDSAYVSPSTSSHTRRSSTTSDTPPSPPPTNVTELQIQTFHQLRKRKVRPFIEQDLRVVQCSGQELSEDEFTRTSSGQKANEPSNWLNHIDPRLYLGMVSALIQQPRFLSVTLGQDDAPSILVDKSLLGLFGSAIAGDTEGELVPIFLDLVDLPLGSTGIVCGVASKLVDEMRVQDPMASHASDLSYLSTARAGAVMLPAEGSARALETLLPLLEEDVGMK